MTYCVAMLLDTGLVFLSDSRTSAGVDQISTFRKTAVFKRPGDRVLVLQTAGNLAITQAVTSILRAQMEADDDRPSLMNVPNLFEAARLSLGSLGVITRFRLKLVPSFAGVLGKG